MTSEVFAYDTETELISEGNLAPRLVCVTSCGDDFEPKLYHQQDNDCYEFLEDLFKNKYITCQNGAFDHAVVARRYPSLLPLIFQALHEGRVVDTRLAQRLIDIATGCLGGYRDSKGVFHRYTYSLDALHQRFGFGSLEKDQWRLRYCELINTPLDQWPEGAKKYALDDAVATRRVHGAQSQYEYWLKDSPAQARAAFSLHLMSCHGMVTDRRACQEFIDATKLEIERARILCLAEGIVKPDGKRSLKTARALMKRVCEEGGLELKMTDPSTRSPDGEICLDAESCRDTGDETLKAYATYTSASTLLKKSELLLEGSRIPLQTSFESLLETGRTSSRKPMHPLVGENFQNMRRAPGMRECFVPRKGFVYCSVDYDMAELRTVSQICLWVLGESKLAEALNAGLDVHCVLGAELLGVEYEEMFENRKVKDSKYYKARQNAKNGNFMLWGGAGPDRFVATVNAAARKKEDRIDIAMGKQIKVSWQRAWNPQPYFDWINEQLGDVGLATIRQFVSERVRAQLNYPTAANSYFQGLAADAAKSALLPISHECYVDRNSPLFGSRPVLFIHDEFFVEIREEVAHEAAYRLRDIAVECFNKYTPDVPVTAKPAIMRRWDKNADTVFDSNERLICWEDSEEFKKMNEKKEAA